MTENHHTKYQTMNATLLPIPIQYDLNKNSQHSTVFELLKSATPLEPGGYIGGTVPCLAVHVLARHQVAAGARSRCSRETSPTIVTIVTLHKT